MFLKTDREHYSRHTIVAAALSNDTRYTQGEGCHILGVCTFLRVYRKRGFAIVSRRSVKCSLAVRKPLRVTECSCVAGNLLKVPCHGHFY